MKYLTKQVVFQEVPDEITLSYLITGCELGCPGCHSKDAQNSGAGKDLTLEVLTSDLVKYKNWISCVCFMGGEWEPETLSKFLKLIKLNGLKTSLYTGQESISSILLHELDYLKTGKYISRLGGLDSPETNQKLYNLNTGECLNYRFYNKEVLDAKTQERSGA